MGCTPSAARPTRQQKLTPSVRVHLRPETIAAHQFDEKLRPNASTRIGIFIMTPSPLLLSPSPLSFLSCSGKERYAFHQRHSICLRVRSWKCPHQSPPLRSDICKLHLRVRAHVECAHGGLAFVPAGPSIATCVLILALTMFLALCGCDRNVRRYFTALLLSLQTHAVCCQSSQHGELIVPLKLSCILSDYPVPPTGPVVLIIKETRLHRN